MSIANFNLQLEKSQSEWRTTNISNQDLGTYKGVPHPWILRNEDWKEGLWFGIRDSLPAYLGQSNIEKHRDSHNLKSSWVLCANLFFPFRDEAGRSLLAGFLQKRVSPEIRDV